MKIKVNKKRFFVTILLILLLGVAVGLFTIDRMSKTYKYNGVSDVLSTYFSNKKLAKTAQPLRLDIQMSSKDFDFIKKKRQIALDRGLQINEGDNYVNCKLAMGGHETEGVIRLKGHMTDHLEGNKWSYRIKTKGGQMGMYRFTIQHPGTRGYIYEWVYHELLKNEGVIHLLYDFVDVSLNNQNLGIYAVEEHFGQHVLERNNRPKGMIVRWNPNLYWERRIAMSHKKYVDEQYADYTSSFVEPYDKGVMKSDPELLDNYMEISRLLNLFRNGSKTTSEVFDVDKMAKFHAIIDLVGGHHSLDWSDVKLYYNSETKKIEPVGYESFSIRKTERIAGQQIYRTYDDLHYEYHNQLFADPIFFESYIQNLERIASEEYMNAFISKIQNEFNEKLAILSLEWPYRKFDFEAYFENVRLINKNLQLPKPFHAFIQSHDKDSIVLSLAPVSDYPLKIVGIKKKNKTTTLNVGFILPPKARQTVLKYSEVTFYGDFSKLKDIVLLATIPGSSSVFEVALAKYPKYKRRLTKNGVAELKIDTAVAFVSGKEVFFKSEKTIMNTETIIPSGYTLHVKPGQEVVLKEKLIIKGKLSSHGFEGNQCVIKSNDNGLMLLEGSLSSSQTSFSGNNLIASNQAKIDLYECVLYDIDTFISDHQSKIDLNHCIGGSINTLANFDESDVDIVNSNFKKGHVLFVNNASNVKVINCNVSEYNKAGILDYQSQISFWSSSFKQIDTLFVMTNSSSVSLFGGEINTVDVGFVINENNTNMPGKSGFNNNTKRIVNLRTLKANG